MMRLLLPLSGIAMTVLIKMNLRRRYRVLWKIIVIVSSIALIISSLLPLFLYSF